ncbi:hypothetical protein WJX81_000729, partial [Elliptochloris bilobata]
MDGLGGASLTHTWMDLASLFVASILWSSAVLTAQAHATGFDLELLDLWPAHSTARVKPRPWPVGPSYNSSEFNVFINTTYVVLNGINYMSPTFNNTGYPPGPANVFHNGFLIHSRVLYPMSLLWTLTYEYQINQPPPLGHPDCQFPELTLPGMCANMIVYLPATPNATLEEMLDQMTRYNVLPKLINVTAEAGAPPIMPPDYVHREIVKGALAPLGKFRSPLATRTNFSTLHLYGPGLTTFEDWKVQATVGALWDAFAEVAVYLEVLKVQVGVPVLEPYRGASALAVNPVCIPDDGEGLLCAPCGAGLAGPSVLITFSYDYFDVVVLDSEYERFRPVLTKDFTESLRSRGIHADAVRIEPASALAGAQSAHPLTLAGMAGIAAALVVALACAAVLVLRWRSCQQTLPQKGAPPDGGWKKAGVAERSDSEEATDEALRGLTAYEDIAFCRRPDGKLWLLGSGTHGKVFRAVRKGVQDAAVKLLTNVDTAQLAVFLNEIRLLERISHDRNIVQFYGACLETNPPMLVMEYMGGGDLYSALQSNAQGIGMAHPLSWWRRGRSVALDIARGLHFLHSEHVVHNDLKTKNILLSDNYETAKIADVGLARIMDTSHLATGVAPCGTFAYAAPELLMGTRCDEKVDIYSFGVVLWELLCRERPLRGHLRAPRVSEECPASVKALVDDCIEAKLPSQRPSAYEVFVRLATSPATLEEVGAAAAGNGTPSGNGAGLPSTGSGSIPFTGSASGLSEDVPLAPGCHPLVVPLAKVKWPSSPGSRETPAGIR